MDKIIISIVGRDPDGVINAVEVKCLFKGKHLKNFENFEGLRNKLCLILRQWSKGILASAPAASASIAESNQDSGCFAEVQTMSDAATKLLKIVNNARGDNLERAKMAFRGLSPETMQKEYGTSGETCQNILDSYLEADAEWQAAKNLLVALLAQSS